MDVEVTEVVEEEEEGRREQCHTGGTLFPHCTEINAKSN